MVEQQYIMCQVIVHVVSFDILNNPFLIISARDEESEGRRGEVTFSRSHGQEVAGVELWPSLWGAL